MENYILHHAAAEAPARLENWVRRGSWCEDSGHRGSWLENWECRGF